MIRSRLLYAFSLLLSLLLALGYGDGSLGFTLFYALLVFLALSLFTVTAASRILVEETMEQDIIFKGDALSYTLQVNNRGFFFYPRAMGRIPFCSPCCPGESSGGSIPWSSPTGESTPSEWKSWWWWIF